MKRTSKVLHTTFEVCFTACSDYFLKDYTNITDSNISMRLCFS